MHPPREVRRVFPEELRTDRLLLERICRERVALDELYRIRSGEETETIARHLPWGPHETPKETADLLDRAEREWEAGAAARYLIRPRNPEPGAGEFSGYTKLEVDRERRTGSLGVWLRPKFWGRGYSGERAGALLELAFDRLALELVEIVHRDGNENSRRAVERYVDEYGGRYDGRFRNSSATGGEAIGEHRYTIAADEYVAAIDGDD